MLRKWSLHSYRSTTLKWWCTLCTVRTLSPYDYWLFLRLKTALRGCWFEKDSELLNAIQTFLNAIPKAYFQKTFLQHWEQQLWDCTASIGRYFEKETHVTFDDKLINLFLRPHISGGMPPLRFIQTVVSRPHLNIQASLMAHCVGNSLWVYI